MIKKILIWIFTLLILGFSVSAFGNLTVTPGIDAKTASVGDVVSAILTINNGDAINPLSITLPNPVNFIGSRNNETISISYNEITPLTIINNSAADINYTFTVPSNAFVGLYTADFNFTTSEQAGSYATHTLTLTVDPNTILTPTNITTEIARTQSKEVTLNLANSGNTDISVTGISVANLVSTTNSSNTIASANINIGSITLNMPYGSTNSTTVTIIVPENTVNGIYEGDITISGTTTVKSLLTVTVVDPVYGINTGNIVFPPSALNETVSVTFSVKNTENTVLNNLVLNTSSIDSRYSFTLNQTTSFSLGLNESRDIKADVFIPYEERRTEEFSIGTISVAGDNNFTSAYDVRLDVKPSLYLKDLDIFIDDDRENDVEDGEKIGDKAEPGSEIKLRFILENTFSEESDIDIDDITITVTLIDSEDEEVEELDVDVGDLDADEKSSEESITFELPLDVHDGKYTLEIEIEGEDSNGISRDIEWTVYFELEKKSHDVIIYKAYLTPETVKCGKSSTLYVKLMNIGEKTENDVRLTIVNEDLDVNVDEREIELSKNPDNKDNTYSYEMLIGTEGIEAETYPIIIKAYFEDDITDDIETVNLVVEDCSSEPEEDDTTVVVQQPDGSEEDTTLSTTGEEIPTTTEISFMESGSGIVLLLLGNIIVLAVVVFFVAKFFLVPKIPKP